VCASAWKDKWAWALSRRAEEWAAYSKCNTITAKTKEKGVQQRFFPLLFYNSCPLSQPFPVLASHLPLCSRGETNGWECWGGIIDRCTGYPYWSGLYWPDQIHWDGVWNSTQMQRRIVFIVNAIFKCLPNLTFPASLLLVQLYSEAACLYSSRLIRGVILKCPEYVWKALCLLGLGDIGLHMKKSKIGRGARVSSPSLFSVKDTQSTPPNRPISTLFFLSRVDRHVCVCVCADTGIFALAKQGSCIDLCDCDEFGIVIWIYWLMWPSEYGPASLSASQPPQLPLPAHMHTEDNCDFKCSK